MFDLHESARPRCVQAAGGATALLLLIFVATLSAAPAHAASLRGTKSAMNRQYAVARVNGASFARTSADVYRCVDLGTLVRVAGNADFELDKVSYPFCRPETKAFIERLAADYRAATGEKLVITSLTRPLSAQPRNASELSVHPAGMALDIRRSNNGATQRWLERELLALEGRGLIDATKERRPPHYHVAVFPGPQPELLAEADEAPARAPATAVKQTSPAVKKTPSTARKGGKASVRTHKVRRGESLWLISQRYDCSVRAIKKANSIASNRLMPGQVLRIPARR
jgi:hypothetical protein